MAKNKTRTNSRTDASDRSISHIQMTKSKSCIIGLLVALIIVIFVLNFYFVSYLNDGTGRDGSLSHSRLNTKAGLLSQVRKRVKQLKPVYLNRNPRYYSIRNKVWRNFEPKPYENVSTVWDIAFWVSSSISTSRK